MHNRHTNISEIELFLVSKRAVNNGVCFTPFAVIKVRY